MHTKEKPQPKGDFIKSYDKVLSFLLKIVLHGDVHTFGRSNTESHFLFHKFGYPCISLRFTATQKLLFVNIISSFVSIYPSRLSNISQSNANLPIFGSFTEESRRHRLRHPFINRHCLDGVVFFLLIDSIRPQEFSLVLIIFLLLL